MQAKIAPVTIGLDTPVIDQNWKRWFLSVVTYDTLGNSISFKADANIGYSYQVPLTGFSIVFPDNCSDLIINPAGTLATGTLTMPKAPIDGQRVTFASTQIVTALTNSPNSGQTLRGPLTTIAANGFASWRYVTALATWFRIG